LGANFRVVDRQRPVGEPRLAGEYEIFRRSGRDPRSDGKTLVHQRRQRYVPAVADLAETLRVGNAHVGEIDLVETRLAARLTDRPDLDARAAHVEEEHRQALVLGDVGVGAYDQDAPVAEMGARGPDFLAIDDPFVALALGARAQPREIGARGGFG